MGVLYLFRKYIIRSSLIRASVCLTGEKFHGRMSSDFGDSLARASRQSETLVLGCRLGDCLTSPKFRNEREKSLFGWRRRETDQPPLREKAQRRKSVFLFLTLGGSCHACVSAPCFEPSAEPTPKSLV